MALHDLGPAYLSTVRFYYSLSPPLCSLRPVRFNSHPLFPLHMLLSLTLFGMTGNIHLSGQDELPSGTVRVTTCVSISQSMCPVLLWILDYKSFSDYTRIPVSTYAFPVINVLSSISSRHLVNISE